MAEEKKPPRRYVPGGLEGIFASLGADLKEKRLKAEAERKAARERGETVPEKPRPVTQARPNQPTPAETVRAAAARLAQERKRLKPKKPPTRKKPSASHPRKRGKFF